MDQVVVVMPGVMKLRLGERDFTRSEGRWVKGVDIFFLTGFIGIYLAIFASFAGLSLVSLLYDAATRA